MHKVMVQENAKLKKNGQPILTCLPKPCDLFDLIGGTGTGGCVLRFKYGMLWLNHTPQDSSFDPGAAQNGRRYGNKPLRHLGKTCLFSSEAVARRWKVQSDEP